MKWVATKEEMPEVGRRVLCAMYADTEYGFPVCGFFDGGILDCRRCTAAYRPEAGTVLGTDSTDTEGGPIAWT